MFDKLFQHQPLTKEEARSVILSISREEWNEARIASFITVYRMRPIRVEELEGFREALLELRVPIDLEGRNTIDIVGTGGDGKNTFNISTTSSFVVAGAGYLVSKHGNYGASSVSGSSNVLQKLGYRFTDDRDTLLRQLDRAGICFFHAPLFHPALKAVGPVRRALGFKTFFNMLGPLVNPARPRNHFLGTFSLELNRLYQYILQAEPGNFAIVYALDGYDEISLTGPFKLRTQQSEHLFHPSDLNTPTYPPEALSGGNSVDDAARIFLDVLENKATPAQRDVVIANAGMAIHTLTPEKSLEDCLAEARESLESGRARQALDKLLEEGG
ncbi:MAG: anthranilate phosphoribosyltransferase [Bacteroidetes bacterium]|nr:MAG: anthranilate phosphoribosyltransferase [Bacteroidota bacterium]